MKKILEGRSRSTTQQYIIAMRALSQQLRLISLVRFLSSHYDDMPVQAAEERPCKSEDDQDGNDTNGNNSEDGASVVYGSDEYGAAVEPFPAKLYRMLQEAEENGHDDVVSFFPHGRAFRIHQPRRFTEVILPRYSNSTLPSFQRQLGKHNFKRITEGSERGGYFHQYFVKGKKDLAKYIKMEKATTRMQFDSAAHMQAMLARVEPKSAGMSSHNPASIFCPPAVSPNQRQEIPSVVAAGIPPPPQGLASGSDLYELYGTLTDRSSMAGNNAVGNNLLVAGSDLSRDHTTTAALSRANQVLKALLLMEKTRQQTYFDQSAAWQPQRQQLQQVQRSGQPTLGRILRMANDRLLAQQQQQLSQMGQSTGPRTVAFLQSQSTLFNDQLLQQELQNQAHRHPCVVQPTGIPSEFYRPQTSAQLDPARGLQQSSALRAQQEYHQASQSSDATSRAQETLARLGAQLHQQRQQCQALASIKRQMKQFQQMNRLNQSRDNDHQNGANL